MSVNATDRQEKGERPISLTRKDVRNRVYSWSRVGNPALWPGNEGGSCIIPQDTTKTWVSPAECWDHDPLTGRERINA